MRDDPKPVLNDLPRISHGRYHDAISTHTRCTSGAYFCSCGVSGPSLWGAGVSPVPLPSEALGALGIVCSPPDGVVAGADVGFGAGVVKITEPPKYCEEKTASTSEVIIKMPAAAVVSLPRKLPGPRGPNTVWLAPPNAAPMPAPFPACKRTIRTKATATITWITTSGTYSQTGNSLPPLKRHSLREGRRLQACATHQGTIHIWLGHQQVDVPSVDAPTILDTHFIRKSLAVERPQ